MHKYNIDLHIHTVLSPCAHILMTPGNIVEEAKKNGLDLIAITDHNSARNVEVACKLAQGTGVTVLPGMEVETTEEVHLLCLFAEINQVLKWQEIVYDSLPDLKNDEEVLGYQIITDESDDFIDREERLLATATSLSTVEVFNRVKDLGGFVIPSHIDRTYGLVTNLGLIPPEIDVPVVEIFHKSSTTDILQKYPFLKKIILIKNSDSHFLDQLKPVLQGIMTNASFDELLKACYEENGRKLLLHE